MPDFDEDLIWDTITEKAKSRVDYARFSAFFPFSPDNFLSSAIYGFAVGRSPQLIADKIAAQVQMTGNTVDVDELRDFIADSEAPLSKLADLTRVCLKALEEGEDEEVVYNMVLSALS